MEVHDHLVPFHLGGRGLVPACGCLGSGGTSLDPALPVLHRAGNAAGRLNPLPDVQRCFLFLYVLPSFFVAHGVFLTRPPPGALSYPMATEGGYKRKG